MEKLNIEINADQMYQKMIEKDIKYINHVLKKIFDNPGSEVKRGWTYITIRTPEAVQLLRDNGFTVSEHEPCTYIPPEEDGKMYKIAWSNDVLPEIEEQA